ncbi:O-methyltransferase [Streptomyces sp. TR1341]|uniref:class I SAM-dependent methyltransferase n=1 Tax=Streptomyces sp. TR1341 TaxID=2601266 RepID=UPI00138AD288|nr:O-methyltransferase [Streptomyces sp. TR1341]
MYEPKNPPLTPELYAYVLAHNPPLDPVLRDLVTYTQQNVERSDMQSAAEQGPLLAFLARLIGARQILEVGTFTGFSALALAQALPSSGGRVITCDISEEWTAVARKAWAEAGVADRIDLRIAPALDTLRALPTEPWIDLVFLDADKPNYIAYWEELVPRVLRGGLIVADNTLFHGKVVDPSGQDERAAAVHRFNEHIAADPRVETVLLTVADGVTLARRH